MYPSEVRPLKETTKNMLKATALDYWRQAATKNGKNRE